MMLEDYTQGSLRKGLVILTYSISYAVTAVALYALVKLALIGFLFANMAH